MRKRYLWVPLVLGSVAFAQEGEERTRTERRTESERRETGQQQQEESKRAFTLVDQLGSGDRQKREEAMRELREMGDTAIPALEQGARSYKADIRLRSVILLREVGGEQYADYDPTRDRYQDPYMRDRYDDRYRERYREDTYERDRYRDPYWRDRYRYEEERSRYDDDRFARDRYREDRWYEDRYERDRYRDDDYDRYERDRFTRDRFEDRYEDRYGRDRFQDRYGDRFDRERFEGGMQQRTTTVREIGIQAADVDPALKAHLRLDRGGVVVHEVQRNTPAEQLGLQRYDVVVQINNQQVADPQDLGRVIRTSRTEGEEMKIVVIRKGERKELSGKVDPRQAERRQPQGQEDRSRREQQD